MKSVADDLRGQTTSAVLQLSLQARIALALSLGDADVDRYGLTNGLDCATALARLRAQRSRESRQLQLLGPANLAALSSDMRERWLDLRGSR